MESNEMVHQPTLGFLKTLSGGAKALLAVALLLLIGTAAWALHASWDPAWGMVEVREVTDSHPGEVVLTSATQNYRTMELRMNAFHQDVTYTAGLMKPQPKWALLFILLQVVAWSLYLTASTFLKSFWAYIAMVPFAMVWYLSLFGNLIAPGQGWIVGGGWILLLLVLAFLLQNNALRLPILPRWLAFLALMMAPVALIWGQRGPDAFHTSAVSMYLPLTLLMLVAIVLLAREPTHLLLLLANNAKDPKRRLSSPFLIGVWTVLVGLEFCVMADVLDLKWVHLDGFPLRPLHLVCLSAIVSTVTLQNQHVRMGAVIPRAGYMVGLAGVSLFVLATTAYYTSTGSHFFLHMVERLAAIIYFIFGVLHLFFLFYNFGPLLRDRKPIYWASAEPKRLMYFFVVLLGLLIGISMEAAQGNKTIRFLWCTVFELEGDRELLLGHGEEAMNFYKLASGEARTVKGNYNFAQLTLETVEDTEKAAEHLEQATVFFPFPYASINKANLEQVQGKYLSARTTLQKSWAQKPTALVANNLAGIWMRVNEPDSAITVLKEALQRFPDDANLYSTLGQVYMRYHRDTWAQEAFANALSTPQPTPAAVTNALYYNLTHGDSLKVPAALLSQPRIQAEEAALLNHALGLYKLGSFDSCQKVVDTLLAHNAATEASLVDGMLKFERGQMDLALSRMEYIAGTTGVLASQANHFLGVMYFRKGAPEMAAQYFGLAAQADTTETLNYMRQAQMVMDAGWHEKAHQLLQSVRVRDEAFYLEANKEIAILLLANGETFGANLEYDLSKISVEDRIRAGRYAAEVGRWDVLLDTYRQVMDTDSSSVLPQLEFARTYRRQRDTSALRDVISNLEYALTLQPKDPALTTELVFAKAFNGQAKEARTLAGSLDLAKQPKGTAALLQATLLLAEADTAGAISQLEAFVKGEPLDYEVNRLLCELYQAQREYGKGFQFIFPLVNALNHQNAEYWAYTARFQLGMSDPEAAGHSAIRAIALSPRATQREAWQKEFAAEIRLAVELNPSLKVE